jgi:EmrB/QacA subfamily drug resistance transporter
VTSLEQAPAELDARRWWAYSACLVTLSLTFLDGSIVTVALPSIGRSTGAQPSQLQWVISAYALGFGLIPIIGGRLGDDRGRKQMLLLGSAVFILTSALCGLAPNPQVLIGARFVQGLAGGLVNPQVAGVVQSLFPRDERAKAYGLTGTLAGLGIAVGPVLGGFIIFLGGNDLGWRFAFLINIPVGVAAFVLCIRWLPEIPRTGPSRRLDLVGCALLTLGLIALLFPLVEYDSGRDLRWAVLLVPAAVVLAGFFWWEAGRARARGHPLIDVALFRIRAFADGCTLALVYMGAMGAFPLVLTLYLQEGLGYSALHAASIASASAIGMAISAFVAGRLLPRFRGKVLVVALILFAIGDLSLTAVVWRLAGTASGGSVGLLLLLPLALSGLGLGGVSTPNQALSYTGIDAAQASTAGGMLQTANRISIAIDSAIATAVFYTVALNGGPASGRAHQERYGHAYAAALIFILALALGSLGIAIRTDRRDRRPVPVLV